MPPPKKQQNEQRNHDLSVSVSTTGSTPRWQSDLFCLQVNKNKQLLEAFHYHPELKPFLTLYYEDFQIYRKDEVLQLPKIAST